MYMSRFSCHTYNWPFCLVTKRRRRLEDTHFFGERAESCHFSEECVHLSNARSICVFASLECELGAINISSFRTCLLARLVVSIKTGRLLSLLWLVACLSIE